MKTYGSIKYSTVGAPASVLAGGICENYNYKKQVQTTEVQGESGDIVAAVLHGEKGEISFSVTPAGNVTVLVARAGAELTVTGISTGKVIVHQASAKWQRGNPMTMDVAATHYGAISDAATGTITPEALALSQTQAAIVLPTDKVWFGTNGITGAVEGIVQSVSLSESVQIAEEEDNTGAIVALAVHSYKATASMEILTSVALSEITLGDTLDIFGSFSITSADEKFSKNGVHTISVEGILIPGVTA